MTKSCTIGTLPGALVQSCSLFAENQDVELSSIVLVLNFQVMTSGICEYPKDL